MNKISSRQLCLYLFLFLLVTVGLLIFSVELKYYGEVVYANSNNVNDAKSDEPVTLKLSKAIDRQIQGNATHSYLIDTQRDQYIQIVIVLKGIHIKATIYGSDKRLIQEISNPSDRITEEIHLIAPISEQYTLEITSPDSPSLAGYYQIELTELRKALPNDVITVKANNLVNEAYNFAAQKSKEGWEKSISKFKEALEIFVLMDDLTRRLGTLNNIGTSYVFLNNHAEAIKYFEQEAELERANGLQKELATSLKNIADRYYSIGNRTKAKELYLQSLNLRNEQDHRGKALTLNSLALTYVSLGEFINAVESHEMALEEIKKSDATAQEIRAITVGLGTSYARAGRFYDALKIYQELLDIKDKDWTEDALLLLSIGYVYLELGDTKQALKYFEQSLELRNKYPESEDLNGRAITINNIAAIRVRQGDFRKALQDYEQVLKIFGDIQKGTNKLVALNNIGFVHSRLGNYQTAFQYFHQAEQLTNNDAIDTVLSILNNKAIIFNELGDYERALTNYGQILKILENPKNTNLRRTSQIKIQLALTNTYIAELSKEKCMAEQLNAQCTTQYSKMDCASEYLEAIKKIIESYNMGLKAQHSLKDLPNAAFTLYYRGRAYSQINQYNLAVSNLNAALALFRQTKEIRGETLTLYSLAQIMLKQGENNKALKIFENVLNIRKQMGDLNGQITCLYQIAYINRDKGELNTALKKIKGAIDIIEQQRGQIALKDLRTSYFAKVRDCYDLYIDLLMRLHRTTNTSDYGTQAFYVSEKSRTRTLIELLTLTRTEVNTKITNLVNEERRLRYEIASQEESIILTREKLKKETPSQEKTILKNKLAIAEQKTIELREAQQQLAVNICEKDPNYCALKFSDPLKLTEIQQQVLDDETLLLEYSLGEEHSYAWLISKNSIRSYVLPKRAEIEAAVTKLRKIILSRNRLANETDDELLERANKADACYPKAALEVSKMVLWPLIPELTKKRIVIVADGELQMLPFSLLPVPPSRTNKIPSKAQNNYHHNHQYQPLIRYHELVNLPSISALAVQRKELRNRPLAPKKIVAFANPVFSPKENKDNTSGSIEENKMVAISSYGLEMANANRAQAAMSRQYNIFEALPENENAVGCIADMLSKEDVLALYKFDANLTNIQEDEIKQYQAIHFGTHGLVPENNPELVGIVLSLYNKNGEPIDGYLGLSRIFNLNLQAELVTLSACDSGLGKKVRGEGLVGMVRGFMYAGARRVVVSSWKTKDKASSEFMQYFYKQIFMKHLSPATALRETQLYMLDHPTEKEAHLPYYWATFNIHGEWQ